MGKNTWNAPSNNAWITLEYTCYFYLKISIFFSPKLPRALPVKPQSRVQDQALVIMGLLQIFWGVLSWEGKDGLEMRAGFPHSHIPRKK